jgi:hypothetical protein
MTFVLTMAFSPTKEYHGDLRRDEEVRHGEGRWVPFDGGR